MAHKGQFKKGVSTWNKGLKMSEEHKRKLSDAHKGQKAWNKGIKISDEQKMKISKSKIGVRSPRRGIPLEAVRDEKNPKWKGDDVSYGSLHAWVRRRLGKIEECAFCGGDGRIEWASISHKAKRDLSDFIPLCIKCHRQYDSEGGYQFWQV